MSDDRSTSSWSALDRLPDDLREATGFQGLYSVLTDEELSDALLRDERGEPDPPEIVEKLRRHAETLYVPPEIRAMSDEELIAQLERDAEEIAARESWHTTRTPRGE